MSNYLWPAVTNFQLPVTNFQLPQFDPKSPNARTCTLDVHEWIGKVGHLIAMVTEVTNFLRNRELRDETSKIIDILFVFCRFYKNFSILQKVSYSSYLAGLEVF